MRVINKLNLWVLYSFPKIKKKYVKKNKKKVLRLMSEFDNIVSQYQFRPVRIQILNVYKL